MSAKVLFSGATHVTSGRDGAARSADGRLSIALPDPHPAAESLFGAAWSACFMGAIELAASQRKVKLPAPPSIDASIDLLHGPAKGFFLKGKLDVKIPEIDRTVAGELMHAAHEICPYSKATRGKIEAELTLV